MPSTTGAFRMLDANDPADAEFWVALWTDWPGREVQAHPGYVRLFAGPGSRSLCASWQSPAGCVLYPVILRDISAEPFCPPSLHGVTDIITPYGYGGPFCWGENVVSIAGEFWAAYDQWSAGQNVVSEFVRFGLFADCLLDYPGETETKQGNVIRDLRPDEDAIIGDYGRKVRMNVRRAIKSGATIETDVTGDRVEEFLRIYNLTMERLHALKSYYFPRRFFEQIHADLPGQFAYFYVMLKSEPIAAQLVLISSDNAYAFLAGSDQGHLEVRPNELLYSEITMAMKRRGLLRYVLGGGYEPGDGVWRFKLSFAPSGVLPFKVGRRILDQDRYDQLAKCRRVIAEREGETYPSQADFFPIYRA